MTLFLADLPQLLINLLALQRVADRDNYPERYPDARGNHRQEKVQDVGCFMVCAFGD